MRTDKQIQASRANGARSCGPVTPAGKSASSRNAVKHGILSEQVVLHCENEEHFLALVSTLYDEFQPATPFEESLVDIMAVARWRQERVWNYEKFSLDLQYSREFDKNPDPDRSPAVVSALAFSSLANDSRALDLAHRYDARLDRQYLRAHRRLLEVQAARPQPDLEPPAAPEAPGPRLVQTPPPAMPVSSPEVADPSSEAPLIAKGTQAGRWKPAPGSPSTPPPHPKTRAAGHR